MAADSIPRPERTGNGARPTVATAASARHRVTELLTRAGISPDSVPAADALLITSELVTNAIRHGGGISHFHATVIDDSLRVAVSDANPAHPSSHPRARGRPGGYGWPLIQLLAERVDITPLPEGGKTITATQRLKTTDTT
ncbi:ATP-binding protein [Streptomyces xanthophaeus]|uniref:ATP-binding protein n=1 Tax=Streptomyces xanthophaeus TaxID=67385 RepID=UPI001F1E525E|nr:ATP-binding protein [Streptomyces xanthophaeus]